MNCHHGNKNLYEEMHAHLKQHVERLIPGVDIQGLEMSTLIRMLANDYSAIVNQQTDSGELSGPRMGILMHLMVAEERGKVAGTNPTTLSHFQNVKKNTISSLLRGLEENGLIERTLDPNDKRVFLIRITPAGKDLVRSVAPRRLQLINDLSAGLTSAEKSQLIELLNKLRLSMRDRAEQARGAQLLADNAPLEA